jgi:hypothetical protein
MVDQIQEKLAEVFQGGRWPALAGSLPGAADVPFGGGQDRGRAALVFGDDGAQEVDGFDRCARADPAFGQLHDLAHPWRQQNAFPHPVFTGSQRAPQLGMQTIGRNATFGKVRRGCSIGFLAKSQEQMLGTDVIMVEVAALLFGKPQYALGGRAETGKHAARVRASRRSGEILLYTISGVVKTASLGMEVIR